MKNTSARDALLAQIERDQQIYEEFDDNMKASLHAFTDQFGLDEDELNSIDKRLAASPFMPVVRTA